MLGGVKKCAKCDKQVYPVEELKCLDKVWHKLCFKCTVCGMTLNMKNYKGFDKQPYCATHYPQQKHTVVADNPEIQRIKENTKIQSNAKYHEDFEKSKGSYIAVAADLEMNRAIENQKLVSGVEYKYPKNKDMPIKSNTGTFSNTVTYKAGEMQTDTQQVPKKKIGSIADYDPLADDYDSKPKPYRASNSLINRKDVEVEKPILGFNVVNNKPVINEENNFEQIATSDTKTTVYKAIYDYDEREGDEISFRDGDRFLDCQIVDVGWMVGRHEKSGKYGLFPSNYVEPIETL